jgi:transposase
MASIQDIDILRDLVANLLNRVALLEQDNANLRTENAVLKSENASLRAQLHQNSNNSHKPPSTDGFQKKPALPKPKGKKTGGQFGHIGKTLKMVSEPDNVVIHAPISCPCCQKIFSPSDIEQTEQKRQVFDIPAPRLEVTEHQLGIITCCGQRHKGTFPSAINQAVQYGSNINSLSVLLNTDYKLPFEKIEQLLGDLYACSFNESTAISANIECHDLLEPIETTIKTEILASPVVHYDETGMRVQGQLQWFHTASTLLFTYLFVHPKRGIEALNSAYSLIKDFTNRAIHDCWKSYFDFKQCSHALCNAHIVRELEALKENGSIWAIQMQDLLLELFFLSEKATKIVENKQEWLIKYQAICQKADKEEPPPIYGTRGRPKNSKGRNLLNRLVEHQEGILAFAFILEVPFTNNQAERDIRPLKTKQKVATSFRTFKGAQNHARIQSFVSTLRKHKMNVFQNICLVFDNQFSGFKAA